MSSSDDGDYIGSESCIYDVINDDVHIEPPCSPVLKKQSNSIKKSNKREFPPPIPFLTHSPNLSFHMPWEFKRYSTGDGRLILREEKSGHHHFFRSLRSNGRLTLQLVQQVQTLSPSQAADDNTASEVGGDESPKSTLGVQEVLPRPTNCNLNFHTVSSPSSCLFETPTTVNPTRTIHG